MIRTKNPTAPPIIKGIFGPSAPPLLPPLPPPFPSLRLLTDPSSAPHRPFLRSSSTLPPPPHRPFLPAVQVHRHLRAREQQSPPPGSNPRPPTAGLEPTTTHRRARAHDHPRRTEPPALTTRFRARMAGQGPSLQKAPHGCGDYLPYAHGCSPRGKMCGRLVIDNAGDVSGRHHCALRHVRTSLDA